MDLVASIKVDIELLSCAFYLIYTVLLVQAANNDEDGRW